MSILITGGAGFIGSHTVSLFQTYGEDVIVLDNLSTGHKEALKNTPFYLGDIKDSALLDEIFSKHNIQAVMHFAASALVKESVIDPIKYYENNVLGTYTLLRSMIKNNVKKFIFSSTAAVYGNPSIVPIPEKAPTSPTNPYGETKLAIEKMLHWFDQAYGLKYVTLRYFNAAGADPAGKIGEAHSIETHLIPISLQVALGQREAVQIFGDDYDTRDGSCIRDFIHVLDLAEAHYLALKKLKNTNQSDTYNLGNGQGFSVKEVLETCSRVTGINIASQSAPRRAGDPAVLVASSDKAKEHLGWKPKYASLETIVEHAWNWHKNNPQGYKG